MLMAGIDGIKNKIDPGNPTDMDIYALPEKQLKKIKSTPATLEEALDSLEKDHSFLLNGDVFPQEVIDTYLEYRRNEVAEMRQRPHPYEFYLYYDG